MLRNFLRIWLLLAVILSSQAVDAALPGIFMGNHDGFVDHNQDIGSKTEHEAGAIWGLGLEIPVAQSKTARLRFELSTVNKRWTESYPYTLWGSRYTGKLKATFKETVLAALFMVRFIEIGATPYLIGGPEIGINSSATYKISDSGYAYLSDDIPEWADVNPGFNIGAGGILPIGKLELVAEMRYNWGFRNLWEGDDTGLEGADEFFDADQLEVKLRGWQFRIGLQFGHPVG